MAAAAGFEAVGLWYDPTVWTAATTAAVAGRLADTGLFPLDIEPVILGRGADPGDAIIDVAAELGVRHVLVASGPAERGAVVDRFGELCRRAEPAGVTVVLEFLPIFTIGTLGAAVGVVTEVGHPARGGTRRHAAPGPLGRLPRRPTCRAGWAAAVRPDRRRPDGGARRHRPAR